MSTFRDRRQTIDQDRRRELCRRILESDAESADCARSDLAALYREAGHGAMARVLELSPDGGKRHARAVLYG